MTPKRIYPLDQSHGAGTTDSYRWRQVRVTSIDADHVLIAILDDDGNVLKEIDDVWFDLHEHFDPDVLWYSEYVSTRVVKRPALDNTTEGLLLVNTDQLDKVPSDPALDSALKVLNMVPKWPKNTGL